MNAYVDDWNRRLNWHGQDHDPRPGQLCETDAHLSYRRAGRADADRVPTGVARIRPYSELVLVWIGEPRLLMIVGGWPVVMVRMIVLEVLVDVQRRSPGA